jgi:hypothetical protein
MANNKMGIVQYWVFKRPKTERGRIVYGAELGATKDNLNQVFQGETLLINNGGTVDQIDSSDPLDIRNHYDVAADASWEPISGQPWILHSVHFGVAEALKSAKPLIVSNGEDNVKICKILSHETIVQMA